MNKPRMLQRLDELKISVSIEDDRIRLCPASRVPQALADEIRQNKSYLLAYLRGHSQGQVHDEAGQEELLEIELQVQLEGHVLLWSTVLEDFVAFYRTADDVSKIPPGFVSYSTSELWKLFGERNDSMSAKTLKRINEAKKAGAVVVDVREEHS